MEGEGEQTGILGAIAGSLQNDASDLIPRPAQANAYKLMQVTGAREHRSSAPINSPPKPPPPPPGWVAGGGADYTYIDEDAPDDGHSRAAIEYATVADYTPAAEYLEPAVVGADYEYGSVLTTSSAAGGRGDNDVEYVEPNAIDEDDPDDGHSRAEIEYATVVDGVQLGSDLPGSSIYETANTSV